MKSVFSYRLKSARKALGYSMEKLAEEVGVSKQMISKYEKGLSLPASDTLIKLAKALQLSPGYFFEKPQLEVKDIKFRNNSRLSKKEGEKILFGMHRRLEKYLQIEHLLGLDSGFIPPLQGENIGFINELSFENAEKLAEAVRKNWNIGTDPISNVIFLLEEYGIKVVEMENDSKKNNKFDGMATIINGQIAVIVTRRNDFVERKRFTLLHELGHLMVRLHVKSGKMDNKTEEKFCNRFAGAMLLPKEVVWEYFGHNLRSVYLDELAFIQEKYGISIKAIVYRLKDLGVISQNRFEKFFKKVRFDKQLERRVDKERFPGNEVSGRFEALVYKALSEDVITMGRAAELLDLNLEDLRAKITM